MFLLTLVVTFRNGALVCDKYTSKYTHVALESYYQLLSTYYYHLVLLLAISQ
jgi:hypothetical protein